MRTTPIDLSQLPAPDIVDELDYETILAEKKARLVSLYPKEQQDEIAATLELESEPMVKLLQEGAYEKMLLLALINEKARGILLAYAKRSTLEHIGALFDVDRLLISPGDPDQGIDPVYEDDDSLRERIQLAPRGFSVAGPDDAYVFHARAADGRVKAATAYSPSPCVMIVTILSREGDGTASQELINIVDKALEKKRPQADEVIVQSAKIVPYAIRATLRFFNGPDRAVALAEAKKKTLQFAESMHRPGSEVTKDGLYASMRVAGVQKVLLDTPAEGVPIAIDQAPYCTGIELMDGGVADE
ncbi:TPA: baseplate J/gp47 family protein [Burkholderia vietnamiensis]|uniref:Baseplate assembly protein n=1 Tax=Burkholderia vietnamiensis TaxID=60552 RepID=A0AA45BA36_BURVI|nr:baseplate J/gp47 family protein [Burkholderia vietnamiensis]KVS07610.1 baseplate assembly protein [Burkholderia vietnamiensis]MCA8209457.1 baseplate J/gp47 family protein [Burkholderia vietnamiensis]MDN8071601.1 baseplate J/gp47 family protein [Burkholderia vietnamiensis]PRH38247.1 baseplate assembly protein [Burkholderia vietnamiensis]HDR8983579.1 baseplate J/gp47 family protein [Burkholderia vietnamiensis]